MFLFILYRSLNPLLYTFHSSKNNSAYLSFTSFYLHYAFFKLLFTFFNLI